MIYPIDLLSTDWYKQLDFDGDGVYDVTFGWNQYKKIHLSAGSRKKNFQNHPVFTRDRYGYVCRNGTVFRIGKTSDT